MICNLNGSLVTRVKDTIFIPLPHEQWRETTCACEYCSATGKADIGFWDTLAVAAHPPKGNRADYAWTVHYPALHGIQPKRK